MKQPDARGWRDGAMFDNMVSIAMQRTLDIPSDGAAVRSVWDLEAQGALHRGTSRLLSTATVLTGKLGLEFRGELGRPLTEDRPHHPYMRCDKQKQRRSRVRSVK